MTKRTRRLGLVLAFAGLSALLLSIGARAQVPPMPKMGMVCTPGGPEFDLVANAGSIETPDGNSVFMWSFANQDVQSGRFQTPGPVLCVNQGDTVTVNLHNGLDVHPGQPNMVSENVSMVFPGQESVTSSGGTGAGLFTNEAAPGGDVTYTFTASQPGTYVYESGSDPSKQVEMGLYGALVVRPSGHPDWAYGDSSSQFNPSKEFLLLLNEIDPDLHHAVETGATYDFTKLHNRYFAVNGREFPDTIQDNGVAWLPNQPYGSLVRVQPYCNPGNPGDPLNPPSCTSTSTPNNLPALIRMVNVGELNHPYHPHGNHLRQIAQDGRPFASGASSERFAETIGSGQTEDYLFTWTDQDFWDSFTNQFPNGAATVDYRNLTFKDGNTFFSGSAYLGRKGTLPTGVVSQNICGEWYFPWHSHALNEFSNFDEGFGGMATLLRVDPRGGCVAYPSSTKILAGSLKTGSYSSLAAPDSAYYQVNSTTTGTRTSSWYGQFSGIPTGAANPKATYRGNDTWVPTTQNFNTLATSGTSSSLPAGWFLAEAGTGANPTYAADNGTNAAGNTYSYGATGNSERAFGGLRTGTLNPTIGAQFTNATGGTITSLTISYTGELWRYGAGSGPADRLDFQYSTNASSLTTGTWSDVNNLDFSSPGTGTAGSRNGNASANRTAKSFTITGLSILNGSTYWLRWTDFDRTGTDDGLAIDDFSLTPAGPTVATTVSVWNWSTSLWTQIAGPTAVGATDVTVADDTAVPASPPGSWAAYVGTGANKGLVRVRVLSTGAGTANFVTGGNFMKLVYDAP